MARSSKPVALITGVSSGIGLATAQYFLSQGWLVVGTVRGLKAKGLAGMSLDVQSAEMTNSSDLQKTIHYIEQTYGRLDALICNAGYALIGPIDTSDYNQIRDQFMTNTVAPAELTRLVIPIMKKQGYGSIVYVSSVVGRIGLAGYSLYSSSKWAIEGLAESLSLELKDTNIGVKLVEPSGVNTAFWTSLKRGSTRKWEDREIGRIGSEPARANHGLSPDKVAKMIFRAANDSSSKLRYPLGQTRLVELAKRLVPDRVFRILQARVLR